MVGWAVDHEGIIIPCHVRRSPSSLPADTAGRVENEAHFSRAHQKTAGFWSSNGVAKAWGLSSGFENLLVLSKDCDL